MCILLFGTKFAHSASCFCIYVLHSMQSFDWVSIGDIPWFTGSMLLLMLVQLILFYNTAHLTDTLTAYPVLWYIDYTLMHSHDLDEILQLPLFDWMSHITVQCIIKCIVMVWVKECNNLCLNEWVVSQFNLAAW